MSFNRQRRRSSLLSIMMTVFDLDHLQLIFNAQVKDPAVNLHFK